MAMGWVASNVDLLVTLPGEPLLPPGVEPQPPPPIESSHMTPGNTTAWLRIGVDTWALGLKAARVVGLRGARIAAGGPAAGVETWLMLSEKWQSAVEVQCDLLLRGPGSTPVIATRRALAHYRRKVAANDQRLS